jgi:hypothetical protein
MTDQVGEFEITGWTAQPDGTIMVYAKGVTPSPPFNGTITARVLRRAIPRYMTLPAVREMHDTSRGGLGKMLKFSPLMLVAHIVNPITVQKVKHGIYTRLEIGGRVRKRDGKVIHDIDLTEVSLVAPKTCEESAQLRSIMSLVDE